MNKIIIPLIITIIGILGGIGISQLVDTDNQSLGADDKAIKISSELLTLVGTHTGTSTVGVPFHQNNATSSYPFRLGARDNVTFTFLPILASTTAQGPNIQFSLLGSNDTDCATASTTSGTMNPVLVKDINWYDVGDMLLNKDGSTSFSSGTSTFTGTPLQMLNKTKTFVNLNVKCLRLDLNASGTVLMVEAMAR